MPKTSDFETVFLRLKALFEPYAGKLKEVDYGGTGYFLETTHIMTNKQRLFFGGVRLGKAYVSFHLFPVYMEPALLKDISPELKKRMQGKACFNFTSVDEKLFQELASLTRTGYASFKAAKYV